MPLSQAQLIAGDSTKGTVLPGRAQGVVAGAGIAISPAGVISVTRAEPWTQDGTNLYPTITTSNVALGGLTAASAKLDILAGVYRGLFDDRAGGFTVTSVNAGNSAQSILTLQGSDVNLVTNGVTQIGVSTAGLVTVRSLGGTGTRMVTASATGVLSAQALPSEPWTQAGTNLYPAATATTNVGVKTATPWSALSVLGNGTAGDPATARQFGVGSGDTYQVSLGYFQTGAGQPFGGVLQALDNGAGTRLLLNPSGGSVIAGGGTVTLGNLAGAGTRMVVADANGLLSSTTIPAGNVTGVTGTLPIVSSGGAAPDISINAATTTTAGSMSSADKTKLDGLSQVWTQAGNSLYPTVSTSEVAIGGLTAAAAKLDILATTFRGLFDNRAGGFTISAVDPGNTAYDVLALQGKTVNLLTGGVARISVAETGPVTVGDLAGAGTRMVTASATGVLSTQAIPAGGGEWTQAGGFLYPSTLSSSVGIGVATPAAPLDIKSGTFRGLFDDRAGGFTVSAVDDGNTAYDVLSLQGSRVQLNPGGGGVGVGTTTVNKPGYSLQVNGAVLAVDANASYAMLETVTGNGFRWILSGGNLLLQNTTDGFATGANPIVVSGTTIQFVTLAGAGTRMVVADANGLLSSAAIPPTYTLPARLGTAAQFITDWNDATENGWYQGNNAANAPTPTGWYLGTVVCHNPLYVTQTVFLFLSSSPTDTTTWQRTSYDGAWGPWYRLRISQEEQEALYPSVTGARASGTWGINVTGTAAGLTSTAANWVSNGLVGTNVVGLLGWKNFGNGHIIFDASAGTAPNGDVVDANNATNPWVSTYPSLMGWNGAQTYGVRVDSARLANNLAITDLPDLP